LAVGSFLPGVRLAGVLPFWAGVSSVCCALASPVSVAEGFFTVVFDEEVLERVVVVELEFCAKPVAAKAPTRARMANNFLSIA
jgi:hypothetical protein